MGTQQHRYGVMVEHVGSDYVVTVRDLPEVVTAGNSMVEALMLAADAIAVVRTARIAAGWPLSEPSQIEAEEHVVTVTAGKTGSKPHT